MRSAFFVAASTGAFPTPRRRTGSSPSSHSAAAAVPSSSSAASFASSSTVAAVRHLDEYRRNVGICLVNASGKVFAARRIDDTHGSWQMPQGGIDHLENPLAAAARELREETGIVSARVVAISRCWHAHDAPTRVADPTRPGALLSFRGQTQKWVLMLYYGDETEEIDLGPEATREFSEWGWRDLAEVAANVVPFKRRAYEAVAREFGPVISARARSGGPGEGREGQDDEGRRLVGWWGLSHPAQISHAAQIGGGHQTVRRGPSGGSARLLQSQILPASGVAMEVKGKQQQQQRERQR